MYAGLLRKQKPANHCDNPVDSVFKVYLRWLSKSLLLCFMLLPNAQSATLDQNLQILSDALGYGIENGYVSPDGEKNQVPASVFATNIRELRNNLSKLGPEEISVLKKFAYREDGSRAYFMVKMTDDDNELRLGYQKVYVGRKRIRELLDFLLLDATYHAPLSVDEQVRLVRKTGTFLKQDAAWQDHQAFRKIMRGFSVAFSSLKPGQRACLRKARFQVNVKTRRFQPVENADTSELRINYDKTITVSHDRSKDLMAFLLSQCRG